MVIHMRFSIVVVCLNAGERLKETIESIRRQTFQDYEVIVKDGLSKDHSVEQLRQEVQADWLTIYEEEDNGIYDAMNQAVRYCRGDYVLFLNCGDCFYDDTVLAQIAAGIHEQTLQGNIFYGNIYEKLTDSLVSSNPQIDAFACYRNVPCHQCCFYDRSLFTERGYDTRYRVRADYEHFLWSFFVKGAVPVYLPVTVASYEGGGFSETEENQKTSAREHKEITKKYMTKSQIFKYRLILLVTLAPLRTKIARNRKLAGFYNSLKKLLYRG
ncbi:MAG: glycosyltransferase [Clostridiales bacterium]|nr:glycosyltransferase [Clostridiales bacterium]